MDRCALKTFPLSPGTVVKVPGNPALGSLTGVQWGSWHMWAIEKLTVLEEEVEEEEMRQSSISSPNISSWDFCIPALTAAFLCSLFRSSQASLFHERRLAVAGRSHFLDTFEELRECSLGGFDAPCVEASLYARSGHLHTIVYLPCGFLSFYITSVFSQDKTCNPERRAVIKSPQKSLFWQLTETTGRFLWLLSLARLSAGDEAVEAPELRSEVAHRPLTFWVRVSSSFHSKKEETSKLWTGNSSVTSERRCWRC